jgi:hypothetical protein
MGVRQCLKCKLGVLRVSTYQISQVLWLPKEPSFKATFFGDHRSKFTFYEYPQTKLHGSFCCAHRSKFKTRFLNAHKSNFTCITNTQRAIFQGNFFKWPQIQIHMFPECPQTKLHGSFCCVQRSKFMTRFINAHRSKFKTRFLNAHKSNFTIHFMNAHRSKFTAQFVTKFSVLHLSPVSFHQ